MPRKPARAPKPLIQTLPLAVALEELRQPGYELVHLHLPAPEGGHGYYVVPIGGRVSVKDAAKILQRPDVQPHSAGLFLETVRPGEWCAGHERGARPEDAGDQAAGLCLEAAARV
jgi:hypothetical protein